MFPKAVVLSLGLSLIGQVSPAAAPQASGTPISRAPEPLRQPPWMTPDDVPASIFMAGVQGTAGIRLSVDPDGRPFRCDVTTTSNSPEFDRLACLVALQRARFRPARDAQGARTFGSYSAYSKWVNPNAWAEPGLDYDRVDLVLPVNQLPRNGADSVRLHQVVEANGKVSACRSEDVKQNAALTRAACGYLASLETVPMRNSGGGSVGAVYRWTIKFTTGEVPLRPPAGASFTAPAKP
jgi:TonB family protein